MNSIVETKREEIKSLCSKFHVKRLELFGSSAKEDFRHTTGDIDFLVEFDDMGFVEHSDAYFDLKEELEAALGCTVDLVETKAIKNPYFLESVNKSRTLVYVS